MRRALRVVLFSGLFLLGVAWLAPGATAAAALVTADDTSPTLAVAGNGWTVPVDLTNQTDTVVTLAVPATSSCTVTPKPATLPPAAHTSVTFAVSAGCGVKDGFDFTVTASAPGTPSQSLKITAAKAPPAKTDWAPLRVFLIVLPLLLLVAIVFLAIAQARSWKVSLPYLGSSWSFSDSWVNNVTAGAALLTGIFGSTDVVKAILGKDADQATALATVGAAIAAAFVAAAPLTLAIFKDFAGNVTIHGLLLAAAMTLTGAFGEVWVVSRSALKLDIKGLTQLINAATIAIMVLLALYAWRALQVTIVAGTTKPVTTDDAKKHARHAVKKIRDIRSAAGQRQLQAPAADGQPEVTIDEDELELMEEAAWQAAQAPVHPEARVRSALL